jgi:molybdopterin/thiamine biosynthesis adenylyltransferase
LTVDREENEYHIVDRNFSTADFNENQIRMFKRLLRGEGIENKELLKVFNEDIFEHLLEKEIILPYKINNKSVSSRNEAYFFNMRMKDAAQVLKMKKVLVLGCGGLGTHMAWNMVSLGVGTVYLLDYDVVEASNLNRQIYFDISDVGRKKTAVLKEKLQKVNPNVNIIVIDRRITSEVALEQIVFECCPDCIIKALDSPVYITQWVDGVCEKHSIKYVSAIMYGCSQMIGPTYIPGESLNFSDFFQMNVNRDRESGIAPSLGFVMYQMAGEISEEVFKILTNKGKIKYRDKMILHDNVSDHVSVILNRQKYPREDSNYYVKNNALFSLCLIAIYFIGTCLSWNMYVIWIVALSYTVLVPGIIAHDEKEAFKFSFILLFEIIVCNILLLIRNGIENLLGRVDLNVIPILISTLLIVLSVINLVMYLLDYIIYWIKKMIIRKINHDRDIES